MNLFNNNNFNMNKKCEKAVTFPSSCQQMLQVVETNRQGIFGHGNGKYSCVWKFRDINYRGQTQERQGKILLKLAQLYDRLSDRFKVIIYNQPRRMSDVEKEFLYPEGPQQEMRDAFNVLIMQRINEGRKGLRQDKYLVVTTEQKSMDAASTHFVEIDAQFKASFAELGSSIEAMTAEERVEWLYNYFHPEAIDHGYHFDYDATSRLRRDWRNDVAPSAILQHPNDLEIGDTKYRYMYVSTWPTSKINDRFLSELSNLPYPMIVTVDISPIDQDETNARFESIYMDVSSSIVEEQSKALERNQAPVVNFYKERELARITDTMKSMDESDERMYFVGITIGISASSFKELDIMTENIASLARGYSFTVDKAWMRQVPSMVTALPIGPLQTDTMRTMMSQAAAALMPFSVCESQHPGSIYFGQAAGSHQPIFLDRLLLPNKNGLIFGKSGFGKSYFTKFTCQQEFLRYGRNHRFLFLDPQVEKRDLIEENGGSYIHFGLTTDTCMNPMEYRPEELVDPASKKDLIGRKAVFLTALIQMNTDVALVGRYKNIIIRCANLLYNSWDEKKSGRQPQLSDFYDLLLEQPEVEAEDMALAMESMVSGPLAIFNCQSSVSMDNRIIGFGFDGLSKDLFGAAMLIVMEFCSESVRRNYGEGYVTWMDVDEFHYVCQFETTALYFLEWYKMMRKMSCCITAITQNVADVAKNDAMEEIIANTEFMVMMAQGRTDIEKLVELVGYEYEEISKLQMMSPGTGLIRYGNTLIEFDNRLPKDHPLYQKWNTDGNQA